MVEEAPAQPSRNEEVQKASELSSSSLMKKVKAKIRAGPKNSDMPASPSETTRPERMEPELPPRARRTVDRFCQAHGFSNPLQVDPNVPGKKHSGYPKKNSGETDGLGAAITSSERKYFKWPLQEVGSRLQASMK
ncbi:hypothetical protein PGT21_004611 [Puccinia graminis f. sp. tritici]|uniref:Uncharacterized protein n=1 Tax=Puccinia graminis f. sp. tritici TaxID=56615 RepID=A0A5B0Q207_PUCGR|nr:hypothetical protein PGT21_004611 [Puccinia graminis f. sp. tritici]